MENFNAQAEVISLHQERHLSRRKRYRRSRLDRYQCELLSMRDNGASHTDLQYWLAKHGIDVHLTTITRWFNNRG